MSDNILILSAGTRNKIICYFKEIIGENGKIVATDMSSFAPAIYEADKFYLVPKITDPEYIDIVLDICKKENITAALSLIDPELSLLAKNEYKFREIGVKIIGSSYELCERSLNKWKMHQWLKKHGYKSAKSYVSIEDFYFDLMCGQITYPVFVKPICGSASYAISKVDNSETLEMLMKQGNDLMIQEFLDGEEIGADVYIDLISKEVVSIFTKKKLLMRAGETDKSVSIKNKKLFDLIEQFVIESGYSGQIDIDIFDVKGEFYISEVNPRFGGGYPHAHECGCNHMRLIKNNLEGVVNQKEIGNYDEYCYMMKYSEMMIRKIK